MKRATIFIAAFVFAAALGSASGSDKINENIVKVYTTSYYHSYYKPWQMEGPGFFEGSGCIIEGRLILTNAHVVSDQTFIAVKRSGQTKKYSARVKFVAHESDLAVLDVNDPKFYPSTPPLELGELPMVADEVSVYGFPGGAEQLTITKGIVSRVSHERYSHSSLNLLSCQIDAAINWGNSGGPVIAGGKVAGIAMMAGWGENEGYMVPAPVIKHFLMDVEDGEYDGIPDLAVSIQSMENQSMRKYYGLDDDQTGVLVKGVSSDSPTKNIVMPGDVILSIDGTEIASDGTISFRGDERTSYEYAVQKKQMGENVSLNVLRGGKVQTLDVRLSLKAGSALLVPREQFDKAPSYYIYAGLVFSPITENLLREFGDEWWTDAPLNLLYYYTYGELTETQREAVVIIDVLSDEVNLGYEQLYGEIVVYANGRRIGSMRDLVDAFESNRSAFQIIETQNRFKIILDRKEAEKSAKRILKQYRIDRDRSENLLKKGGG